MNTDDLLGRGIREIGNGFRSRSWSPFDITQSVLRRIDATEPSLHAWVLLDADGALEGAVRAERELASGVDRGPMHGIPIGIKDIFDVAGWPTRCGSTAHDDVSPASQSATSVQALIAGGAIVLGKTTTQEFAAGTVSPPARNPWNPLRIPGGSSGGSAAAVAAGNCFGAMGSDTGGSIRIPAAACGVTGFKPSFGEIDTSGVFPLSWSLDTVGPLAKTVEDTWIMWKALRGAAGATIPLPFQGRNDLQSIRLGVPRSYFFDALQLDVRTSVAAAIDMLKEAGATVVEIPWPDAAAARACAFLINRVETAAVHERVATKEPERFSRYGDDLRLRVSAGLSIPATLYIKAIRARTVLRDSMAWLFAEHRIDALLTPSLPTTAISAETLAIEGTGRDESVGIAWTRLTMPFNATGQPVLAIPCGLAADGLPVGIQLAGIPGKEPSLFRTATLVEGVLGFDASQAPHFGPGSADKN